MLYSPPLPSTRPTSSGKCVSMQWMLRYSADCSVSCFPQPVCPQWDLMFRTHIYISSMRTHIYTNYQKRKANVAITGTYNSFNQYALSARMLPLWRNITKCVNKHKFSHHRIRLINTPCQQVPFVVITYSSDLPCTTTSCLWLPTTSCLWLPTSYDLRR